ncbi:hypothetical protein GGTG_10477 [Gaeumannomyces tritici R3-111a-1]|uniref:Uncharacterized protein n=1 Tax=Gaeumannomyces tritici (strain R3-111a-1) TaxID=644352 RepID=J3PAF1_GAET3|nr:hypothetical protein GGTG_10477 [Gaeumannomyces tritici R3-111a-1]EJT71217.1 hypothetical protein GGTG_10477 [Gaeumannomyces tritici R3-111a-1]
MRRRSWSSRNVSPLTEPRHLERFRVKKTPSVDRPSNLSTGDCHTASNRLPPMEDTRLWAEWRIGMEFSCSRVRDPVLVIPHEQISGISPADSARGEGREGPVSRSKGCLSWFFSHNRWVALLVWPRSPNNKPEKRRVEMALLCGVQTEAEAPQPLFCGHMSAWLEWESFEPGPGGEGAGNENPAASTSQGFVACAPSSGLLATRVDAVSQMGPPTMTNTPIPMCWNLRHTETKKWEDAVYAFCNCGWLGWRRKADPVSLN